jgi:hypothetical protein
MNNKTFYDIIISGWLKDTGHKIFFHRVKLLFHRIIIRLSRIVSDEN